MEALLSENASTKFVEDLMAFIERKVDERMAQKEKRYLTQTEVFEEYGYNSKSLEVLEEAGLRRFKRGKCVMYDRRDIEETIELIKY